MAIDKNKLKQIYSTLQNGGYRQDYQTFEKAFTGNDNYANRKKTYDLLTANGAQIGGSYEEFMKKLQVSGSHSSMRTGKSGVAGGHPMSAAGKQLMLGSVRGLVENAKAGVAGTRNRIANQMAIVKKPFSTSPRIAENKNVREKGYRYNDKSGKLEKTYVTTLGNEYDNRYNADQEQKQIDRLNHDSSLGGQLENAYAERDRLDEALKKRRQEVDQGEGKLARFLRGLAENSSSANGAGICNGQEMRYNDDPEYLQLMAAARKNHTTIQLLEDKRDNKMNEFWHNVGTTMLNGYTFSDGLSEMQDAIALQEAEKHLNSINKKRAKGKKLTRDEQNAEAVLKNFATNDAMQRLYGDDYGAWGRAGKMFATSIDYGKDFLLNPGGSAIAKGVSKGFVKGATKGLTKLAGKQAEKLLAKKAMQYTLKATGIGIGAHLGGLAIANTTALPKTVGLLGSATGGHVVADDKGSYHVVDKQKLLPALVEVERSQAREYGSEMIGEFLPGGKILKKGLTKGLEKIGLSKVASTFTHIGTKQWYKQYSNLLKAGGYNGIPGEVLEEYEGSLFDALTGHADDAWRDMTSLRNHVDIWLGCGTMGAIMGAVPMMGAVNHTATYYGYKHKTNKADRVASTLVGEEKWGAIRDKIDQTENGKMADVLVGILTDKELNDQAKNAALNYARNLTKMRAYNIANVNCAAEESMNATPQDSHGREAAQRKGTQSVTKSAVERMNASYGMGYNTTDAPAMYDANVTLKAQEKRLSKLLGVDDVRKAMGEDPMKYVEKRKQAGASAEELQAMEDYLASDSAVKGIRQRMADNLDSRLDESDAEMGKRVNTEDGMVHKAVMQVRNQNGKEHEVYVLKGNVRMNADGRGVDASSSDNEIYVYDPQEGKTRMMPPSFIERIDEPVDAETVRRAAGESMRQDYQSELAKLDTSGLSFQVGDRYDAVDERGVQHRIEVVGGAMDDAGNAMNGYVGVRVDGGDAVSMRTDEIAKMVGNADVQRREAELSGEVSEDGHAVDADDVPAYAQNEVLTLLNERGKRVRAEITATANEDGLYEVLTDEPIDGKRVSMMSAEEIAAKSPAQEEPSGRMHDDTDSSFQGHEEDDTTHEAANPNDEKSALARIPIDEETKEPLYEDVDADTAWDAIVEQTNGDKALAQEVVDDTVNEMSAGIEKAEKAISKATFKGKGIQERIAFAKDKQERVAALALEKERLAKWKRIASVERMRAAAVEAEKSRAASAERKARQEEEKKARQAREEAARKEREALNGVPNMTEDKPSDARARGYRRVDGHKVDRQAPVKAVMGKEVQVKFDDKNIPAGHVAVVDASELQPSHIGGQRNAKHFIDEAQPKERKDDASVEAARKIASNIRPEEITTSVTAYTGAPTVNSRGEVIQGNNRSAALKEMWASHPEQGARYKQYLKEHAAEYGLTAEDIDKVQSPVLVNMLDVSDADAIALGQFVASDTESGGTERLKPKNVTKKLGDRMKTFSNILLRSSDDESSFSELLDRNGMETLKWLNGIGAITPTQYKSSFDSKGNLTAEAKNDLKGVLYQYVFEGGSTQLEEMFNGLPAKAQRAILSTVYRDYESVKDERMIEEIQDSIMAYHALSQDAQFMSATNHKDARAAVESWKRQYAIDDATGESYLPSEKFSNFTLLLAAMYKGDTQGYIQAKFNAMYDLIQGVREDTLFGTPDNTPRTLAETIKEILNIDYDGRQRSDVLVGGSQVSQAREQGSPAGAERGERGTQGAEAAERGRRSEESSSGRGVEERQEASGETVVSQAGEPLSEKKNSVSDNTTDTVGTAESGKRNDTATPQNTVSDGKDTEKSSTSKGKEETIAGKVVTDSQGNPLNADGTLKLEKVKSVDDLTDEDFSNPTRSVELPKLPENVDRAIGAESKPVIIKKNILKKNWETHKFPFSESRSILKAALYNTDLVGQTQPTKRPLHWVLIKLDEKSPIVVLEVNENKNNVEIVGWYTLDGRNLDRIKRQAEKNGGELVMLSPKDKVESLSTPQNDLTSVGKDNTLDGDLQEKEEKSDENDGVKPFSSDIESALVEDKTNPKEAQESVQAYTIEPTTYTNKKGKTTPMHLVTFGRKLSKDELRAGKELAKESRSWWDKEKGGFMMRSEEAAEELAEKLAKGDEDAVADAQPLSLEDMSAVNDQETVQAIDNAIHVKPKEQTTLRYDYDREDEVRDQVLTGLREALYNGSGIPNIKAIESQIRDLRKRIKTIDNGLATAGEATAARGYEALAMLTGRLKAYEKFLSDIRKKMQETERDEALAAHGVKLGDKILYKGKEATIHDADAKQVILDTGLGPVLYEVTDWENAELPKSVKENYKGEELSTEQKPTSEQPTMQQAKEETQQEKKAKSKWVDDADAARFEELRQRLHEKLNGQLNIGIDPEAFSIGVEMSYLMLKHGARKFGDFARQMVEALGENVRPYLKSFYNGARDLPEMADYENEMTPYDEVRSFDVMNFDKEGAKDIFATAEHVAREQAVEREAREATKKLKEQRNEQRKAIAQHVSSKEENEPKKNQPKEIQSNRKSLSSQEKNIPDLFSGLFGDDELKPTSNEQEVHVQSRPGTSEREGGHQREQNESLGASQQHEDERADAERVVGRSGKNTMSDTSGGSRLSELSDGKLDVKPSKSEFAPLADSERKNTHNNHAARGIDYAPKSTNARIEANIKAIETMQRLIESGEPATPEDMSVLRKFSGWGGLGEAFSEMIGGPYGSINPINKRLRELLSPEAYEAANMSRNSAYYTPAPVIDAMWDVARAMGFRGGNVLEGSAGIGNIIGLMPTDMSERSDIHAVEIDETTGNILSLLYPDANVEVKGFEKTFVPNGSVDLAITNVPFVTGLRVMDETGDKDLSRKFHDIHDFCIAKNVRKLKEGGIGIFISSSGTLDSANSAKLRTWLVNDGGADVVGAFRMHNQTFGGTGATSDIIVIRKRVNGKKSVNAIDVSGTLPIRTVKYNTGETKRGSNEVIVKDLALDVNKHFVEHPEDMAGEMAFAFEKGETYRATSKGLYPSKSINQEQRLSEWAQQFKDMDWDKAEEPKTQQVVYEDLGADVKEGSMLLDSDGNLCLAQRGKAVPLDVNTNKVKGRTKAACFNDYKAIKDALAVVLEYQTTHSDDVGLKQKLDVLNKVYDAFVKTYGHLNKNTSIAFLRNDMDYPSIAALESVSETGDKNGKRIVSYGKTDIFSRRVVESESEPKPTTIKDGIIASLYLNGRVDVPYIAKQLGKNESEVREQIIKSGLGFENPTTTEMEVSYEYLSGNVREKLRQAQENNTDGRYDANIKALERVIPMNIPAHLIEFTLGSSWVDPKLYEDFVKERTGIEVKLTNAGGTWIMSEPYWTNTEQNKAMGVISEKCDKTILGHELIKAAITCKSISVTKSVTTGYGSNRTTETIVDKEATVACANKIDEIRQDFKDWAHGKMQGDAELSERMERVYNELFNNSVPKEIPDEFVPAHFGGAATIVAGHPFQLRPHQAKAVVRATTQPLMLAHEVGTGKTYTLISTAMEMRRLGTARKPMIVVQNATVGQFVSSAKELYPNAKILTLEDADRNADGRRNFYAKIRYNDWDMIVVPQSVFERIPDSEERQMRFIEDKVEEKMMVLEKMRDAADNDRDPVLRQAERELDQLNDELNNLKLALQERKSGGKSKKDEKREAKSKQNAAVKAQEMLDRETDDVANFDDMGVDALLIDEAHEYKHLGFATAMQRGVKGVDPSYSKKSQGVYLKTQSVLENKNGKNVVFATGTPISNTAAEIWTFMRYLMPADTMREYGIYYFDDFVRNFGNIQQMLEFSTSGKYKENNRFAGYVNLPELVRIWSGIADTVLTREAGGVSDKIPEMEGGQAKDVYLPQTKALRGVMKYVKDQLNEYEKMSGKEKKENSHIPLVMYGIAKAAAVDARLVLEDAVDEPNSKTNEAVRQTLRSLEDTKDYNGTVAIFADNYQNKSTGFNLYEDIRKKLIESGVPKDEIVVMKPGMKVKKKLEIFDKVNRGEVRVIMGSTFTLGTGVNIQERLHTLIHVDAPNRPMDYTQRNGRILRQGNLHNDWGLPVRVLRFGVEDSLDVTAYQRLKTKGAIADSIMEGKKMMNNSMENRVLEEDQDLFGDITAQLSGSQYALLKNQVEKEVRKLEARKKQWEADQTYVHNQKPRLEGLIKDSKERAERNREALAKVEGAKQEGIVIGKQKFPTLDAMSDYIKDYNSKQREQQEQVRKASGYNAEAKSSLTVNIGGFDFHVNRVIAKEQKQEKGQLSISFSSKTQMTYSCPELGLEDVPVDGQRLKSALEDIVNNVMSGNDFREKIEHAERAVERYKGELQQVEARDGKPFEYADELSQAKEKLSEYEELMKAEMAEKEAKYAEMDSEVDAAKNVRLTEEEDTEDDLYREVDDKERDEDISLSHDPMGKLLGESVYTDAQRKAFGERERKRMAAHVSEFSEKLNLKNVDVVTDTSTLSGDRRRAKGFFNKKTGRITIVIPNHMDMSDVEKTLLHEAVAHHGLRKLFGDNFDNFLDNVYRNAEYDIRERIAGMASNHGWDVRTATEEYLAGLAEDTNFENMPDGFWSKIKRFFLRMLHSIGFKNLTGVAMGDNELRYVLWRSYENLKEPGRYRNFFAEAADVAKQYQLKVGPYEVSDRADRANVAETEVVRRKTGLGNAKFRDDKREQQTVNERFNNELTRYQNGEMDKNEMLHLGRPQGVMRTFLPNLPIVMRQRVIKKGSEKKHEVDVSDIMNMPQHLSSPIFVFQRSEDTIGVLTDMRDRNGKNVCVAIELKRQIQQGAEYLEVNDVRSFHGREFKNIVEPIANNKTLKWVDKEKGLAYLSSASQPVQQEIDKQVLNTATKLVKDFVNPKVSDENVADGPDTGDVLYRSGEERTVERVPDIVVSQLYEDAVKDTRDRTMLGALVRTWSKDGRIRFKNKFAESWFDYTRSVKALQDAIAKATGRKVEWFEDVWKSLNAKSSIDEREQEVMSRTLSVPLSRHISSMVSQSGGKYDLDAIEAYLNAKHGLERNELMARRAAEEAAEEAYGAEIAKCRKALAADALDTTAEERLQELTSQYDAMVEESYAENRRDYAGLTALFDPEKEGKSLEELEDAARKYISEIEGYYDADTVGGLWDKVRALNNFSLKKSYECGLLSKKQYDDISKMYKWYVPLRGWHDNYAGDVYNYVNRGADRDAIENAVKKAYGRTSRAGNILGTMSAMANSAIVVGNKNKVAQVFMNLALNHEDTGMFTISEAWYEKNEADDSWRIVTPDNRIHEDMSAEEVADTIAEWEDEMQEKAANGKALMRSGKFAKDFQHNLEAWKEQQHCVRVSRGGKEYLVYVNGNPRATQAINGLLNPDYQPGVAGRILQKYMRHLARVQTSWSLKFVISNVQRDVLTATGSAYAKNGAGYALQFEKNFAMNTKDIFGLFYKDLHGSLDMNNAKERMFKEFLDNGGKTGISTIYKKQEYEEKYNKSIYRAMHPASSAVMQGAEGIVHGVEFMNSCIENLTRFSTYMTSRQMGKSIKDAIFDAKECSVNFNMKGSGAWGNAALRMNFLYTNPALQALRMLNSWYEANSVRTVGMLASGVAMGFMVAMVNALCNGGDGDDNAYYGLSDYYRYNYFNIGIGNRKFLHWRLPQEMASLYALGHISYDRMTGRISTDRAIQLSLEQLNNYSPLSFVEGNTSYDQSADNTYAKTFVKAITPSYASPFADAFLWDEDFLGRSIGNRKEWNKLKPEWQRVDKRTPEWFIKPFEAIGKATGSNGYDRKGLTNSPAFNPSAWWYVLMQQGGGLAQVSEQAFNACAVVLGSKDADDMELKDYPLVGTVLADAGTDNARMRIKNERFWMYKCEYEANKATISSINHARDLSPVEKAEKTSSIQDSRYNLMDFYMKKYYKPLRESIAEAEANGDKAEAKRLKDRLNAVKGMLLKRMDEAEDTSSEASPSPSKGGEKAPL